MVNSSVLKLSIIIPVFNEQNTILEIINRVRGVSLNLEKEIIIVDDGSTDKTREILKSLPGARQKIIFREKNEGKGAALRAGLLQATGDFVLFQDADLEYNPKDYKNLIKPLVSGEADLVLGSRVLLRPMRLWGFNRVGLTTFWGRLLTSGLINFLYGVRYTDYYTCYKAVRRGALANISLTGQRFEIDGELVCKFLKSGMKIAEVPISYEPRGKRAGKKISWLDGPAILFFIIKWRFWG